MNARQLHINPPRWILPIVERRVMIQLQTRLHAIEILELDECKAATFGWSVFLCCDADRGRRVFGKVGFDGFVVGGVGEVSLW